MKKPFLMNFHQEVPIIDCEEAFAVGMVYSEKKQMMVFKDEDLKWSARSARMPTSCHTAGHRLKAGYTRSGKYKPSKYISGKTDKRAGK